MCADNKFPSVFLAMPLLLIAAGCSNIENRGVEVPVPEYYEDGSIFGTDGGISLFGDGEEVSGARIGVNAYLWRATLDSLSGFPISQTDPFGGVVQTDWIYLPSFGGQDAQAGERMQITATILSHELRADALSIGLVRQNRSRSGEWQEAPVSLDTKREFEDIILNRARELRIADN